jgi:hypothetical protein
MVSGCDWVGHWPDFFLPKDEVLSSSSRSLNFQIALTSNANNHQLRYALPHTVTSVLATTVVSVHL